MKSETQIWKQIVEIEKILSQPKFKRFEFVSKFIQAISYDKLAFLNNISHDSSQLKRDFQSIKKHLQKFSDYDLQKVGDFFENLPEINKFINLNL